jgi:hypothetical protein
MVANLNRLMDELAVKHGAEEEGSRIVSKMSLTPDHILEDTTAAPLGSGSFAVVKKGIVYNFKTSAWWVTSFSLSLFIIPPSHPRLPSDPATSAHHTPH